MKKRKTIKIKRRAKEVSIIALIILITILIVLFQKQRTTLLKVNDYIKKEKATSYIFKEEEYIILDDKNVTFDVKSGTKVAANTLISNTYKLKTNKYIDDAINVIDYCIANNKENSEDTFLKEILDLNMLIKDYESKYQSANTLGQKDSAEEYETKLNEAMNKRNFLEKAFKYVYADKDTLKKIKSELEKKKKASNKNLTISNLNFNYTGEIFYKLSGYEDVLNLRILPAISKDYFSYIKNYKIRDKNIEGTPIKIINNNYIYACAFLDKNTYVQKEKDALDFKEYLYDKYSLNDQKYFTFLDKRIDALLSYPKISFEDSSGNVFDGRLVDVRYYGNDKVLFINVRDEVDPLLKKEILNLNIYSEKLTVYILPKSAIITNKNKKTYVSVLKAGNFKDLIEVKVFKYEDNKVFLKPSENQNLQTNMEIILNPK